MQLLFAPSFIVLFFAAMATAQGRAGETMARLETSYKDTLITNYKLWPAAQIVNFKFVPLQYQVLFANFVSVFWNAYLSWATNTPTEAPAAAPTA
jgi:protein Mpv17